MAGAPGQTARTCTSTCEEWLLPCKGMKQKEVVLFANMSVKDIRHMGCQGGGAQFSVTSKDTPAVLSSSSGTLACKSHLLGASGCALVMITIQRRCRAHLLHICALFMVTIMRAGALSRGTHSALVLINTSLTQGAHLLRVCALVLVLVQGHLSSHFGIQPVLTRQDDLRLCVCVCVCVCVCGCVCVHHVSAI